MSLHLYDNLFVVFSCIAVFLCIIIFKNAVQVFCLYNTREPEGVRLQDSNHSNFDSSMDPVVSNDDIYNNTRKATLKKLKELQKPKDQASDSSDKEDNEEPPSYTEVIKKNFSVDKKRMNDTSPNVEGFDQYGSNDPLMSNDTRLLKLKAELAKVEKVLGTSFENNTLLESERDSLTDQIKIMNETISRQSRDLQKCKDENRKLNRELSEIMSRAFNMAEEIKESSNIDVDEMGIEEIKG